jgi:hypothetical protein
MDDDTCPYGAAKDVLFCSLALTNVKFSKSDH